MNRPLPLALLVAAAAVLGTGAAGCTLNPDAVLERADLTIEVRGPGTLGAAALELTIHLADGRTVSKRTERVSEPTVLVFEQGTVGEGAATLALVAYGSEGRELGCDREAIALARGARLTRALRDTRSDPAHCGACDVICDAAHATRACIDGICGSLVCEPGFEDLDGVADNGCEARIPADLIVEVQGPDALQAHAVELTVLRPDGQTVQARTEQIAEPTLLTLAPGSIGEGLMGLTIIARAEDGRTLGCDQTTATVQSGARIGRVIHDTSSSPAHCGGCNISCDAERGSRACVDGACGPLVCADGFEDLDGDPDNGCEAETGCTPITESDEATCSNGIDDDCDGKIDCEDPGCLNLVRACQVTGTCMGSQRWDCERRTWSPCEADTQAERTPELCSDGIDNDCDGKTDCQDGDCHRLSLFCHPIGTKCVGVRIWSCLTGSLSLCQLTLGLPESSPEACSDGIDNDCDGRIDCADPGCRGQPCTEGSPCCEAGRCGSCGK